MAEKSIEVNPMPSLGNDPFQKLRSEVDRMWEELMHRYRAPETLGGKEQANVIYTEHGDEFTIAIAVPEVSAEAIDLSVRDDLLVLRLDQPPLTHRKRYFRTGFEGYARIQLPPDIDRERITANFSQHVLFVTVPKRTYLKGYLKTRESRRLWLRPQFLAKGRHADLAIGNLLFKGPVTGKDPAPNWPTFITMDPDPADEEAKEEKIEEYHEFAAQFEEATQQLLLATERALQVAKEQGDEIDRALVRLQMQVGSDAH